MILLPKKTHSEGETQLVKFEAKNDLMELDTFGGKLHVEWDNDVAVTSIGQLSFFIQYLKLGGRFEEWVTDCPLKYLSNNAPKKTNLLGTLLLSILSGHTRYSHIGSLAGDKVNTQLLGMTKVVSDDSASRGLKRINEAEGVAWLQKHLLASYQPLLNVPWILDADVTIKTIYGKQEGAVVGYNPKKPGRPSHTYHTYLIANLRIVLEVEVCAGNESHASHTMPGLLEFLDKLPEEQRPYCIRGDRDYGSDELMAELEARKQGYLFKLKKSPKIKELINKHHCAGKWTKFNDGFEAKEATVQLQGWKIHRRVVIVRRRLSSTQQLAIEQNVSGQLELAFLDGPEDIKLFEYAVLVTNLEDDVVSIVQHYRDRADCENYFDEIKNQWGWGGYTTQKLSACKLMARTIALIYNWWTLFARLANPDHHMEAVTSRPLLLSSVGRLTQSGRQKKLTISTQHGKADKVKQMCTRIHDFFCHLKEIAPQLTVEQRWSLILAKSIESFLIKMKLKPENLLPALS